MVDLTATGSARAPAGTLGAELEHGCLEHRLRRIRAALTALRERAPEHDLGERPPDLDQAAADFEAQATAMQVRLRDLEAAPAFRMQQRRGSGGTDHSPR